VTLLDIQSKRQYPTPAERKAFIRAADHMPAQVRAFLLTLSFTAATISEVLALSSPHIDREAES